MNEEYTGPQLQRQLKDVGLDVKSPIAKRTPGTFWIQLQNGPYDVAHNQPILQRATDILNPAVPVDEEDGEQPMLTKIDVTRDLRGAFYAPGDWKAKHIELAAALEKWIGTSFRDNGNSFNSIA